MLTKFSRSWFTPCLGVLFAFGISAVCRGDDASAKAKLESARALYAQRPVAGNVESAIALLTDAVSEATDLDIQYEARVLASACHYWRGVHATSDKKKMEFFDAGYKAAELARTLNANFAEAFYWSAANLARWAEANGIIASLNKKKELEKTVNSIFDLETRNGDPGETYYFHGADRILTRLYFKAPAFAGGSVAVAMQHGRKAFSGANNFVLNVVWYAEALFQGSASDKQAARQILDALLAKDPNTLNATCIPETLDEWPNAKRLRAEMGN